MWFANSKSRHADDNLVIVNLTPMETLVSPTVGFSFVANHFFDAIYLLKLPMSIASSKTDV